jgi:hypothetical protein
MALDLPHGYSLSRVWRLWHELRRLAVAQYVTVATPRVIHAGIRVPMKP